MAVGREQGAKASPCILKFLARMVVLVSSGENEILPLLVPLKNIWKMQYSPRLEKILLMPMARLTLFLARPFWVGGCQCQG